MRSRQLNYKHLQYFHVVAKEGSITRASEILHLAPQTISGQLALLEQTLELQLFARVGRSLKLTEAGRTVLEYAESIFGLGDQLMLELRHEQQTAHERVAVGVLDSIPKLIAYQILRPLLEDKALVLQCCEGDFEKLMADLAIHKLDMVLTDVMLKDNYSVKAHSHFLGESAVSCFGTPELLRKYRRGFPESLEGAPLLLPTEHSYMGRELLRWVREQPWRPVIRGFFDDSALLKAFGQAGEGLFFMPSVLEHQVCRQFGVKVLGQVPQLTERYHVITPHRRPRNAAVERVLAVASDSLF